jgi:hypothetical protein
MMTGQLSGGWLIEQNAPLEYDLEPLEVESLVTLECCSRQIWCHDYTAIGRGIHNLEGLSGSQCAPNFNSKSLRAGDGSLHRGHCHCALKLTDTVILPPSLHLFLCSDGSGSRLEMDSSAAATAAVLRDWV